MYKSNTVLLILLTCSLLTSSAGWAQRGRHGARSTAPPSSPQNATRMQGGWNGCIRWSQRHLERREPSPSPGSISTSRQAKRQRTETSAGHSSLPG